MLNLILDADGSGKYVDIPDAATVDGGYVWLSEDIDKYSVSDGTKWLEHEQFNAATLLMATGLLSAAGGGGDVTASGTLTSGALLAGGGTNVATVATSAFIGTGDNQDVFPSVSTTGQYIMLTKGTAASPDTTENPLFKVVRTIEKTSAGGLGGDGGQQLAAIYGISSGTAANGVQPVGVYGAAENAGTASLGGNLNADAVGIYGIGRSLSGNVGTGFGGFFQGRRDSDTGKVAGIEVQVANYTATPSTYNSAGFTTITGIFLSAQGDSDSGVAIALANPLSKKFLKGIGFNSQNGGAIIEDSIVDNALGQTSYNNIGNKSVAAFLDSSTSPYGFRFTGTYATGVIETPANFTSNIGFGTAAVAGRRLSVAGGSNSSSTSSFGGLASATSTHASGTMAAVIGWRGQSIIGSTSDVTTSSGIQGIATASSASTIIDHIALHALANTNTGGATITRGSGIQIEAQTVGTAVFQLRSLGTAPSVWAGPHTIGSTTVPTALLMLAAGTATTSTAPLKFTSGTNLTTAEAGAMEYDGTNLFFTRTGTTRQTVLTADVVTTEVIVPDTSVTVNIAGTDYKLLARA